MERTLSRYIRAFRAAGGQVSSAEAIDAARTMALVGYADRDLLKNALSVVLAKSAEDKTLHDSVFEMFFKITPVTPEQATDQAEIARAAAAAGVDDIRFETQKSYYVRQMTKELGVEALEERLLANMQEGSAQAQAQVEELLEARAAMEREARAFVDERYELYGRPATQSFLDDIAINRSIGRLTPQELDQMRAAVVRMAKRLAERHSRRRRRKNRGQLDFRHTLRSNAGTDSVPFDLHWKQKRRDRPKIVVICDVSSSVSNYVRFLLLFLYALAGKVADLRAFAFSDQLSEVTAILENRSFDAAMSKILFEFGSGSTDYGNALVNMRDQYWDAIDRRTTLLILGDGRSNYSNPRLDIMAQAADRAKRVVWLSPEPAGRWGTGDSCMLEYRPFCTTLAHCATATDLEQAIDEALLAYE